MTTFRRHASGRRSGFTLVEVLIVIVIIGLLAGMTTTVVVSARRSVSNSVVSTQMAQLSIALDEYKNKFGEYPPDFSDQDAVTRHIKKRWPRYNVSYDKFLQHVVWGCKISSGSYARNDTLSSADGGNGSYIWDLRAFISPLVFWLGGLPDQNGVPSGFYASPKAPLGIDADDKPIARPGRAKKEKPFFAFDRKFLGAYAAAENPNESAYNYYYESNDVDENGSYIPAYCQGGYPIIYFRPSTNNTYGQKVFYLTHSSVADDGYSFALAYAKDANGWYEEKRFQLIHPGDDGLFGNNGHARTADSAGAFRVVPSKLNLSTEDADNITNFIDGGTLESLYD